MLKEKNVSSLSLISLQIYNKILSFGKKKIHKNRGFSLLRYFVFELIFNESF